MNMFAYHHLVMQVEAGCLDPPTEHARGIFKEVRIMIATPAVGVDHRHTVTATSSTCTLPVVRWLRRNIPHQPHIETADIDAHLQGGSGNQPIVLPFRLLKLLFNHFTFLCRYLG